MVDANTNGRGEFFRDTSRFQFLERETSPESLLKVVSLRWALDRRSQSTRDRAREDSLRFLLACCLDLQKERKRNTSVRENRRKKFPTTTSENLGERALFADGQGEMRRSEMHPKPPSAMS